MCHQQKNQSRVIMQINLKRPDKTSVLIVDDHQLVRDLLYAYISGQEEFEASVASSCDAAVEALEAAGRFDVVLLDAQMPGVDGIVSVENLIKRYPDSAVVIFSGTVSNEYVKEALMVGAKGYIPKTLPFKSLASALTLIASGEIFVPSTFSSANTDSNNSKRFNLSDNELAVLRKVRAGWSNKQIAGDMNATEVTIKMHMRAICHKLGAKNRTQAAVIALREQIL